MLTADQVRTRKRGSQLQLITLKDNDKAILLDYCSQCIQVLKRNKHKKYQEINDLLDDIILPHRLQKVAAGIRKLLLARCDFASPMDVDPLELRKLVFSLASKMRRELAEGDTLKRETVLIAAASQLDIDMYLIDDCLFSDLKSEQRLTHFTAAHPQHILDEYELAQEQAILLKASYLQVQIYCDAPSTYRYFFRTLKFRRLLYEIHPHPAGEEHGYELNISGPHQLFKSVTKYGLQLALILPALRLCNRWHLKADVHWYKNKVALQYFSSGQFQGKQEASDADVPEEITNLLQQIKKHKTQWKARKSNKIINLPGVGISIPDLVFTHPDVKESIYFELMGYWSRQAVWKRVELVEAGLKEKMIFAVSERLRVSEKVLDQDLPSALYVYKGVVVLRSLLKILNQLVEIDADY